MYVDIINYIVSVLLVCLVVVDCSGSTAPLLPPPSHGRRHCRRTQSPVHLVIDEREAFMHGQNRQFRRARPPAGTDFHSEPWAPFSSSSV